jgi:hypothetical protein
MKQLLILLTLLGLLAGGAGADEAADAEARKKAAAETSTAEALEILKRSSDFLTGQKQLSFESRESYDTLQTNGMMIEFGNVRTVDVRRPDRLQIRVVGRNGERQRTVFDGKTLSTLFEDEQAYIQLEKPGSLDAVIDYMQDEIGAPMPLSDFIHTNFYADAIKEIKAGAVVGEETIAGTQCDHIVFHSDELGFQLWIEQGSRPVPIRVAIEFLQEPGAPQFRADFTKWSLGVSIPDESFAFRPPPNAEKLVVRTAPDAPIREGGR